MLSDQIVDFRVDPKNSGNDESSVVPEKPFSLAGDEKLSDEAIVAPVRSGSSEVDFFGVRFEAAEKTPDLMVTESGQINTWCFRTVGGSRPALGWLHFHREVAFSASFRWFSVDHPILGSNTFCLSPLKWRKGSKFRLPDARSKLL